MKKLIYLILISVLLFSCAINQEVTYDHLRIDLPQIKTESLSIAVWDQREKILTGKNKPDFVGYLKSGAGIPYNMSTKSGKPFVDDIVMNLGSSFERNGLNVSVIRTSHMDNENTVLNNLKNSSKSRLILMKCNKLHTDGYVRQAFYYDLEVSIFNEDGTIIGKKSFVGKKELGKGGNYKEFMPIGLKELMEEIFNDYKISNALNEDFKQKEIEDSKTIVKHNNSSSVIVNPDIIYKKDGVEIKSNVIEITVSTIKYRNHEQLEGPIRNILVKDVFMIIYKDGTREVFKK